jgi:predicted nucleic acid-binding protein
MKDLYVIDTTSVISYFADIFEQPSKISQGSLNIIDRAFKYDNINLSIPSIVFIEIYHKWFRNEEMAAKIRYEVFERIKSRENIEIKPLEKEVLLNFISIEQIDDTINIENHDRQILASAMMLNCSLITSDRKIIKYVRKNKVIPRVLT